MDELKIWYDKYKNEYPKQPGTIQMLFSIHNKLFNQNESQWHCSGCVKRVVDRIERHLKNNNMI